MAKWVYGFGNGRAEGRAEMSNLLGGKGANLAEMTQSRPAGAAGLHHHHRGLHLLLRQQADLSGGSEGAGRRPPSPRSRRRLGAKFGDAKNPLLVSVRSGARASMPGMMDTILNLGLNDKTVEGLAQRSGDPRFAYDSYRRFIQMYGSVVLGVDHHHFEELLENHKLAEGKTLDTDLDAEDWKDGGRRLQGDRPATSSASPSRRIPRSSSGARSAPSSAPG